MRWYALTHAANDFHGIGSVLSSEEEPFLFEVQDFEPSAIPKWRPRKVTIWSDRKRKRGDFPGFGRLPPVFNARALEALKPLLVNCDILPLDCAEEPLVAINPPILRGVLDHEQSEIDWFTEEVGVGAVAIHRYVFRGAEMKRHPLFRLSERSNEPIVSDVFREAVEKHGLKGLQFLPLDATWMP